MILVYRIEKLQIDAARAASICNFSESLI